MTASIPTATRRALALAGYPGAAVAYVVATLAAGIWTHIEAPGRVYPLAADSLRLMQTEGIAAVCLRLEAADGAVIDYAAAVDVADLAPELLEDMPAAA